MGEKTSPGINYESVRSYSLCYSPICHCLICHYPICHCSICHGFICHGPICHGLSVMAPHVFLTVRLFHNWFCVNLEHKSAFHMSNSGIISGNMFLWLIQLLYQQVCMYFSYFSIIMPPRNSFAFFCSLPASLLQKLCATPLRKVDYAHKMHAQGYLSC